MFTGFTLIVYVNDIIEIRNDLKEIGKLKERLANEFEIKTWKVNTS